MSDRLSRREFIKKAALVGWVPGTISGARRIEGARPGVRQEPGSRNSGANPLEALWETAKEAMFYQKLDKKRIKCLICPKECVVGDRERGFCGAKENKNGKYYSLVYSRPCSLGVDPIEKKPFFHFLPTTWAFSIATTGCSFDCAYCQNWETSQSRPENQRFYYLPPKRVVEKALETGCKSIAYTYTEPVIFYEYMFDTCLEARKRGVKNVIVTAGYINPEPMKKLCEVLDGVKIDLKGFTEKFYWEVCVGHLKPVLKTIELVKKLGNWLEIVYLVVPTLNHEEKDIKAMCKWLREDIGKDVPLHFTRFHPMYKLKNLPVTPQKTLERCRDIALSEGLQYVYIGNVPGHSAENTYCPKCKKTLILRIGYQVEVKGLKKGQCRYCGYAIPGVWA